MNTRRRRIATLGTAGLISAGLLAGSVVPASAGTTVAITHLGTVKLSVPNGKWTGYECQDFPIETTVTSTDHGGVDMQMGMFARGVGDPPNVQYAFVHGSGNFVDKHSFFLCPLPNSGSFRVTGDIKFRDRETYEQATATVTTAFSIAKMPTSTVVKRVKNTRYATKVIGFTKADSTRLGKIGARGDVVVKAQKPGKRKWVKVERTSASSQGRYVAIAYKKYPRGTRFRAFYEGDNATMTSTSEARRV